MLRSGDELTLTDNFSNVGKCPRCHRVLIAEQVSSHYCCIPTSGAKTIFLDWLDEDFTDENDDQVRLGKGLDGTLYSFVLCKHNPPHSNQNRAPLTARGQKPPRDNARVPIGGYPHPPGILGSHRLGRTAISSRLSCVHGSSEPRGVGFEGGA
jgi:hypothetical protein